MLPRRLLALPLVLPSLLLALTAGCGSDDPGAAPDDTASSTAAVPGGPSSTPPTATPTATPTRKPSRKPSPRPTPSQDPGDQMGNGDADATEAPATAGGGICGELSSAEVGRVLGGTVRGKALGDVPGCTFTQSDARAFAATFTPSKSMTAARVEATSAVEGTPQNVPGVGTAAFVVTGSMFGGPDVQAAGAVQVGARVVSVALNQEKGLPAAQVRDRLVALLRLVVSESG